MRSPNTNLRTAGTLVRVGRAVATWSVSAALVAGAAAAPAEAANQGPIGSSSTGSINISASVPKLAQITGLADVTFTSVSPTVNAVNAQSDCVWSNTATKAYTITATGSGASGAFTLASGTGASQVTVPYSVQWSATSGQNTGTGLSAGVASATLQSTATTPGCIAGPSTTSSLIVSIAAADLQSMVATNSYTGSLTLLVNPQ